MKAKEKLRVRHSTKRSGEESRSRALENQLKQDRGIRLEKELDSPLDILNPPIEGVPLKFQRGGPVGFNRPRPYSERPNLPPIGPVTDPVQAAVDQATGDVAPVTQTDPVTGAVDTATTATAITPESIDAVPRRNRSFHGRGWILTAMTWLTW